jgi:hypothetical protein
MKPILLLLFTFFLFFSHHVMAHVGADASHAAEDAYWAELAKDYPAFTPSRQHRYAKRSFDAKEVGRWSEVIHWPHIAVSASNLPDGRIVTWSASQKRSFPRGSEFTYASTWNPITKRFIATNNTYHDMFAAHLSLLEDGRLFVSGGNNHVKTSSVFDFKNNTWARLQDMNSGRWYPTNVTLPSGDVFAALGSSGGRYPEIWNEKTGWKVLTGVDLSHPILQYNDYYEREWWPLLHVAPLGYVFHSGPTPLMHNISTKNLGSILQVGVENRDWYPKHGTTLMVNEGKLLVAGGAVSGADKQSANKAMLIDINTSIPKITAVAPMKYPRKFHNGVLLPTGEVLVVGGNTSGIKFADKGSVLPVEIWNPISKTWREGAEISVPRNYHSIALLLPDGRVLSAGGGLCNCLADHQDAQIYSPAYLFNDDGSLADRPTLSMPLNSIKNGQTFTVQSDADITQFSLIKMSATTHGVNSDLRYLAPEFSALGNGQYQITVSANRNILMSGYWMLFAINANGVPSMASVVQVVVKNTATIQQPIAQAHLLGADISLPIIVDNAMEGGVFSAENLPQGVVIHTQTGVIAGRVQQASLYRSKIKYRANGEQSEVLLMWNIYTQGKIAGVSYDVYAGQWTQLPDIETLAKTTEPTAEGVTRNFISPTEITHPFHVARLSARINIKTADTYQFFLSSVNGSRLFIDGQLLIDNDGLHSLQTVSNRIDLAEGEHTVRLEYFVNTKAPNLNLQYANSSIAKQPIDDALLQQNPFNNIAPVIEAIQSQTMPQGHFVSLNVLANDANGDPLVFSATGLPKGLSINSKTGVISGIPSTLNRYNSILQVMDTQAKKSQIALSWKITGQLTARKIIRPPRLVNTLITYPTGSNGGDNVDYKWNFGDGSAETIYSDSTVGSHKFLAAGNYTVTLTVKDEQGNTASSQFIQAIYKPHTKGKPTASTAIVYTNNRGAGAVWNVNPDNNSVSGFNASTYSKLTEITVGKKPSALAFAPDGHLWVTNKDAYSISLIDTTQQKIIDSIALPYASQPHGIVFSTKENMAYIVLEASGILIKIDVATRRIVATLNIGTNPRHISLNATEDLLYISRYITPPLPNESTATPQTEINGVVYGGEVLVVETQGFTLNNTIILQHNHRVDAEDNARGIPNYLGALAISPDGLSAWVPSKQDNIKRGKLRDGQALTFDSAVRSISSKINLTTGKELLSARVDHDNGGIASAAIYGRYGSYVFVALEGSREIEILDAYSNQSLFRLKTERAPQGLAISDDGLTLFSHNFMDRSITVYDLFHLIYARASDIPLITRLNTITKESLPPTVLRGKQLFYDSFDQRLAKEQYSSCASCHNEGRGDGRTWDMTGFGEGLRNTISLLGHGGMDQGMLHWSGNFDEVQDFEGQIRGLSGGTGLMNDSDFQHQTRHLPLGTTKTGISQPLDDLAHYVASLKQTPASPYRNGIGQLSDSATIGKTLLTTKGCIDCHKGKHFTDSAPNIRHNIGTIKTTTGQRLNAPLDGLDTPTLLGVWQSAPYLHDGSAKTLQDAIRAHTTASVLTENEITQLHHYLKQLDDDSKIEETIRPTVTTSASIGREQGGGAVLVHWLLFLYGLLVLLRKVKGGNLLGLSHHLEKLRRHL